METEREGLRPVELPRAVEPLPVALTLGAERWAAGCRPEEAVTPAAHRMALVAVTALVAAGIRVQAERAWAGRRLILTF